MTMETSISLNGTSQDLLKVSRMPTFPGTCWIILSFTNIFLQEWSNAPEHTRFFRRDVFFLKSKRPNCPSPGFLTRGYESILVDLQLFFCFPCEINFVCGRLEPTFLLMNLFTVCWWNHLKSLLLLMKSTSLLVQSLQLSFNGIVFRDNLLVIGFPPLKKCPVQ